MTTPMAPIIAPCKTKMRLICRRRAPIDISTAMSLYLVNTIMVRVMNIFRAPTRTIRPIVLVGALNIFITLTMIVLTKYKDIAVLMSMGARRRQIRRIFVLQGAMIGAIGVVIGLVVGYTL